MAERTKDKLDAMSIAFPFLSTLDIRSQIMLPTSVFLNIFAIRGGMLKDTIQKVKVYDNVTVGPRGVGKS